MWDDIKQEGHYIGQFSFLGETMEGEIVFYRERGLILLKLSREVKDYYQALSMRVSKQEVISGKLNIGWTVTLYHNRCIKNFTRIPSYQQIEFSCEYVIFHNQDDPCRKFNQLSCVVENALEWSGLSYVDDFGFDKITFRKDDPCVTFHWYGVEVRFSVYLDNRLLQVPKKEVAEYIERLKIDISCDEKKDIDFFLNIRIFTKDIYRDVLGTWKENYNFPLEKIPKYDISYKLEKLIPVFQLYLSLFQYQDMLVQMVFLNVIQALETLHSRFFYHDRKSCYINAVYRKFHNHPSFSSFRSLLLSPQQMKKSCHHILLYSRLNDLFIGKCDGLFYEFYVDGGIYAQKLVDTRHYYTHYDKSKEDKILQGDDLKDAIDVLRLLLEYHVCLILGIDIHQKVEIALRERLSYRNVAKENP